MPLNEVSLLLNPVTSINAIARDTYIPNYVYLWLRDIVSARIVYKISYILVLDALAR
jgi:hypothetical protein